MPRLRTSLGGCIHILNLSIDFFICKKSDENYRNLCINNNFTVISKDEIMISILGVQYITEKEASIRYSYSRSWFQARRMNKLEPKFVKLQGKILYPLAQIDKWFKDHLI